MAQEFIRTTSTNSAILSSTTASEANTSRVSYTIVNTGTNPLFVKEGDSASTTDFSYVLGGGTSNDNGTGGGYESNAVQCYTGKITVAGTSPRYVITQREQN